MTVARTIRPRTRQLKPLASPGVRLGLLEGGVEFGESDMAGKKNPGGRGLRERDCAAGCRSGVREDSVRG